MRRAAIHAVLVLALVLPLGGCGESQKTYEFTDVRKQDRARMSAPPGMTSAERFGFRDPRRGGAGDPHAGMPGMSPGKGAPGAGGKTFAWKTPEGWEEVEGSKSREATWRVKGEPQTDCSLSKLPGNGGGLLANVNRWVGQMGAQPVDAKALAALPRKPLLGSEAVYLDIPGRYGGMGGQEVMQDARMLGFLLELPTAAVYLKFVGPANVVEANQGAFQELAASIAIAAHGGGAQLPPPTLVDDERPTFSWTLPASWEQRQGRAGRVITVGPQNAPKSECYLYLLSGDGGGIDLNINRWRGQMAQKDLSAQEIAALERIDVLGTQAVLVKVKGPFKGMNGEEIEGALLYGAVILKDSYLLTAKMNGAAGEMEGEWANFIAFCKSIQQQ